MFTELISRLEGVTDLNFWELQIAPWQLSCCHEFWSIRLISVFGFVSSSAISPVCRTLRWRLQGQTFHHLAAVCLLGVRSTDLARKPARYRSLSQCTSPTALPFGTAGCGPPQHASRRVGGTRLANFRRPGPAAYCPGAPTLRARAAGYGIATDCFALDASIIDLCLSVYPWARFDAQRSAP